MKKFTFFRTIALVAGLMLLAISGWGQETILDETLRDGEAPEGWTEFEIDWRTAAGGYALFQDLDSELQTPILDLTGYTNVQLSFDVAKFGTGGNGPLTVEVSDDGGITWDAQTFESPVPADANYLTSGPTLITATGDQVMIRWIRTNSPSQKRLRDVILTGDLEGAVATPYFIPNGGTFYAPVDVEIETETDDATIHYSLVGDEGPWYLYGDPITVDETTTIWAYATAADLDDSNVTQAVFTFPDVVDVADIAELRDQEQDGTVYRLTNEVILTFQTASRNQKFIQDASGAILIDDNPGNLSTEYDIYDGITGITGTLGEFQDMLQFLPVVDAGNPTSIGNVLDPILVTLEDLDHSYEAKLVQIINVYINPGGDDVFENGESYTITDNTGEGTLRTNYSDLEYIGTPIPVILQNLTGVVHQRFAATRLVPRSLSDFEDTVIEEPVVFVNPTTLSGFNYVVGDGPSEEQSFTVTGLNMVDDITISAPDNFEILTTAKTGFTNEIILAEIGGTVTETLIQVRLVEGLDVGVYSGTITISTENVDPVFVSLSGEVTEPPVTEVPFTTDFGVAEYWDLITSAGSYGEKAYEDGGWYFHSTEAYRGGADESFDGSAYSFRDRGDFTINNLADLSGMTGFSLQLRDWMLGDGVTRTIKVSFDGGETWDEIGEIDKAWFEEYQVYQPYIHYFAQPYDVVAGDLIIEMVGGVPDSNTSRINIGQFKALDDDPPAIEEPSEHVTNFTAVTNTSSSIIVSWTDADAEAYLVKGSAIDFDDIEAPIDGVSEANNLLVKNVPAGVETHEFTGLEPETEYFFRIFPYNGSDANVNYKTDGDVPEASAITDEKPVLIHFVVFDGDLANNTPFEELDFTYSLTEDLPLIVFHSALEGYPFELGHPDWRKASMERRNEPTPINYRPEGNSDIPYESAGMRGIQVKQPFTGDGGENTMFFHLPTTGFEEIVFSFAAMDEDAANMLIIDYSVVEGDHEWITDGLPQTQYPLLTDIYQLYEINFTGIEGVDDNPDFMIRIRFDGDDMEEDDDGRVTFNNIALDGRVITGIEAEKLAIIAINNGEPVYKDEPFSMLVEAQDAEGLPVELETGITVNLGLETGTGELSGVLSGTIEAGNTEVLITGIIYNTVEAISIKADADGLEHAVSEEFDVLLRTYSLALKPNIIGAGVLTGAADYAEGAEVTITATANDGFTFVKWTLDGDLFASTPEYTFIMPAENKIVVAHFKIAFSDDPLLVHYWHFNDEVIIDDEVVPADFSAVGDAEITYPGEGAGYMDFRTHRAADPVSNFNLRMDEEPDDGAVLRVRNPANTRELIIAAPSTGYAELVVTFATTRTSNGAVEQEFYFSTDSGNTWVQAGDTYEVPELDPDLDDFGYLHKVVNLLSIEEVNNNPELMFRILAVGENSDASGGNQRFDNFTVDGIPIEIEDPEHIVIAGDAPVTIGHDVTECFFAQATITVAGQGYDFVVEEGGEVTLVAVERITMLHGTRVESGSKLHAYIGEDNPCLRPFAIEEVYTTDDLITDIEVINETDESIFFRMYPNPTYDQITIEMGNLTDQSNVRVEILNLMGAVVLTRELPAQQQYTFSLGDQNPGLYIVRVIQGKQVAVERLIKR